MRDLSNDSPETREVASISSLGSGVVPVSAQRSLETDQAYPTIEYDRSMIDRKRCMGTSGCEG